jgi:integrase
VADLEAIREGCLLLEAASRNGRVGADKALKRLRHFCNWAVEKGYANRTPFKTGNGVVAFHFAKEPRSRRLEGDEEQRLVENADSHLRALVIAALETACRKGELLELRWRDVKWDQNVLLVPASVSKTAEDRDVPKTQRLRAVLEMRRHAPDGTAHHSDAYVFGNDLGELVTDIRSQWERCCTAAGIDGLVFHDLRREAASRLRESGAPDHVVAAWLGHANISTTSRYLRTSRAGLQRYLQGFEEHRERCTSVAHTPSDTTFGTASEADRNPTNTLN